jgi:hypothetical protein
MSIRGFGLTDVLDYSFLLAFLPLALAVSTTAGPVTGSGCSVADS